MNRSILGIALPSIVANITVPLLGLVDVAITGHMGSAVYIGAVAVGSMIFNLVYWLFAFLRMGTSGLTAQAVGRTDSEAAWALLRQSLLVGAGIGLALIVAQEPLRWLMFLLIGPTADVAPHATRYFRIVIWGAPAMLSLYALTGWFVGMQDTRRPMIVSISQNIVNILCSLLLVYGLGRKVGGVALGTVVAQYAGLLLAVVLLVRRYGRPPRSPRGQGASPWEFFRVGRDIFLRTLCLVAVNLYFTAFGARSGAVVLSVNAVLLQFYLLFSYFMDGFANAGEALCGRYCGAADTARLSQTVRWLFVWAAGLTLLFTFIYIAGGTHLVSLLTSDGKVCAAADDYLFWIWLVPAAGAASFIWDGVFIGLTATKGMLLSSVVAAAVFFAVCLSAHGALGNHALWLAQVLYLATRSAVQTVLYAGGVAVRRGPTGNGVGR